MFSIYMITINYIDSLNNDNRLNKTVTYHQIRKSTYGFMKMIEKCVNVESNISVGIQIEINIFPCKLVHSKLQLALCQVASSLIYFTRAQ